MSALEALRPLTLSVFKQESFNTALDILLSEDQHSED